jgi:hypothetical protein
MSRAKYSAILELWGHTWAHTQGRRGWIGPAITDPEDPTLALAVACERIVRRDGRYVMVDPGLTLDRFGWDEEDAEGLPWTLPDGTSLDPEEDA